MSFASSVDDFSYLNDSQMNSSEYAGESNIDPGPSPGPSSLQNTAFNDKHPLPETKYLVITKDPIALARARAILYPNVFVYLRGIYLFC